MGSMLRRAIRASLNAVGYDVIRLAAARDQEPGDRSRSAPGGVPPALPYTERAEYGPGNIATKYENVANGLPFEFPDMVNLNLAVSGLVGDARKVVELGAGTGNFAVAAAVDRTRHILASE